MGQLTTVLLVWTIASLAKQMTAVGLNVIGFFHCRPVAFCRAKSFGAVNSTPCNQISHRAGGMTLAYAKLTQNPVETETIAPRYLPREWLSIDSFREPAVGDFVIVERAGNASQTLGKLIGKGDRYVTLQQFPPATTFEIASESIKSVRPIVYSSDEQVPCFKSENFAAQDVRKFGKIA